MPVTRLESIEDWVAFNRTCRMLCGTYMIIGARRNEGESLWFGTVVIVPSDVQPRFYASEAIYPSHREALKAALIGSRRWLSDTLFEGGRAVPKEEGQWKE